MSQEKIRILTARRIGRVAALVSSASLLGLAHGAIAADGAAAADTANSPVAEVIVTAPRQEEAARTVQLAAPNLISVRAAETILKYPDFNAAEALGRMPGISLSSDTGEGRFVQIRGIDANLDGATYGGIPLLNTNPGGTAAGGGGRAVEYDTIPTGAIDGIVVTYTLLPDHEAEGLGGSIELSPRSAANVTKPFFDGTLGWGDEPLHNHTGPFEADVAFGGRFGFDGSHLVVENSTGSTPAQPSAGPNATPFSFVLYASTKQDRRAIDDLEESYVDDGVAPSNAVSEYSLRRYDYHRRRFSFGGDFEYQPNEDHTFYIRANEAGYTESVHKNILDYEINNPENTSGVGPVLAPAPGDPNGYLGTAQPLIQLTDEEETHRNQIYSVGGVDRWGDVVLDYHAAYSRATFTEHHDLVGVFDGPTVPFTYDNVSTPNYPIFGFPGGFNVNDPSQYTLGSIKNERDVDTDEEFSYAANLIFPVHFINDEDRIKIGAEARLRDKAASEFDTKYKDLPDVTLADEGYSSPALPYYDNHYTTGPEINAGQVGALVNSGAVAVSGPNFNYGSYIAARENIFAGYVEYMTKVGQWGFLAGVRVEDTEANYGGYVATTDINGNTTNALLFRPESYVNAFPTVQVRYDFTPTLIARATYSTGIARPGFEQNTTAASVDFSQIPAVITRGNPDLKPTYGDNFDFSLEDYLPNGGIIQAALFDKEFTNYIAERITNGTTTDPLAPGQLANVTTFLNIPSAWARGIQLDYHQRFVWLPRPFDGFGVEGNLTLVDSHILEYTAAQSLTGVNEYGLLPGTSQVTWNLAGFYEAYGVQTRVAAEYVSHSLFGLGGDKSLDTIQDNRLTMDVTSSYRISNHWTVYFNAKNLLNTPLRYYEGSADRPLQREFYDITVEGGIRAHF
jgi:TonB-dependent receptor